LFQKDSASSPKIVTNSRLHQTNCDVTRRFQEELTSIAKLREQCRKKSENYGDLLSKDSSLESINISQLQEQLNYGLKGR